MPRRYIAEKSGLWCGKGRGLGSRHETDQGRVLMFNGKKMLSWCAVGVAIAGAGGSTLALVPAQAQETVKIGLILPMTGGQASTGKQIDNAVKLYMQQKGDTVRSEERRVGNEGRAG